MFKVWMVWRYLTGSGRFISWTSGLALLGLIIGVGCLVLTMAVVSGVETHLKKSIIDVTGHFIMMDRSGPIDPIEDMEPKLRKALPKLEHVSPFVHLEAMIARGGHVQGVVVQGLEARSYQKVLNLRSRLREGSLQLESSEELPRAFVGTVLAKRLGLKIGDTFQLVVPRPNPVKEYDFSPRLKKFALGAILDMGKYDFNERLIMIEDRFARTLKGFQPGHNSGFRMKFSDDQAARDAAFNIGQEFGYSYYTKDWYEVNRNFFSAVEIERIVIFIVLLFVVIVACFNICSTLFVHVLKRFSDISILKTLGAGRSFLMKLFVSHGMLVGVIGSIGGVLFGLLLCALVESATWLYVPGEIYKFDRLPIEIRIQDLILILSATFGICFLSTLLPSLKGANLKPVEGLRYE